jgi:hypothetical protein
MIQFYKAKDKNNRDTVLLANVECSNEFNIYVLNKNDVVINKFEIVNDSTEAANKEIQKIVRAIRPGFIITSDTWVWIKFEPGNDYKKMKVC